MPLGLGGTVLSVVKHRYFFEDPVEVAYKVWIEGKCKNAANWSLMRIHPLGAICIFMTLEEIFEITAANSTTTHPDLRCIFSCLILVSLIRGLLRGEVIEERHIDDIYVEVGKWYTSWCEEQAEEIIRDEEGTVTGAEGGKAEYLNHFIESNYMEEASWFIETDHLTFASLEIDDIEKIGCVYKALGAAIRCLRVAMQMYAEDENHELEYGDVLRRSSQIWLWKVAMPIRMLVLLVPC
jgi:hypothetical protein